MCLWMPAGVGPLGMLEARSGADDDPWGVRRHHEMVSEVFAAMGGANLQTAMCIDPYTASHSYPLKFVESDPTPSGGTPRNVVYSAAGSGRNALDDDGGVGRRGMKLLFGPCIGRKQRTHIIWPQLLNAETAILVGN